MQTKTIALQNQVHGIGSQAIPAIHAYAVSMGRYGSQGVIRTRRQAELVGYQGLKRHRMLLHLTFCQQLQQGRAA